MSDSDDDFKPPPPPGGDDDIFGNDSDSDAAPPPPPPLADSDDEGAKPKKRMLKTKLDKDNAEGGDASDDNLQKGDSDDDDDDDDDDEDDRGISRRKSFGPSDDDESDDDDDDEDDEDDEDDDDDEEDTPKEKSASRKKKRGRGGDDDGDGGKQAKAKPKKKKKKSDASRFFADMAAVGESDEDEEIGERGVTEEELTAEEMAANEAVEARHAKNREMLSTDAAELAQRYEQQHKEERRRKIFMQEMSSGLAGVGTGTVAQQALLPSVQDPSLWRVKCATGREFQLVRSVLLRHVAQQQSGARKSTLKTCFHSGAKGFIYIEAFSEVCAKDAIMGLRGLYATSFTRVSIGEMTSVIQASVKKKPLRNGQWVRIRRGPLRGDLARVVEVLEGGVRAFIMAVPRPDYANTGNQKSSQGTVRPPQKMFDVVEAQQSSGAEADRRPHPADRRGDFFDFWKNDHYKDGFWYKEVTVETYINDMDVKPRLEELQMFRAKQGDDIDADDSEDEDGGKDKASSNSSDKGSMQKQLMRELNQQMKDLEGEEAAAESANIFRIGDLVEVVSGELRGLVAQVKKISLTASVLEVVPYNNNLAASTALTIEMNLVIKHVFPGAHIKVIGGRFIGNTGRVVSVSVMDGDHIAAVLTDGVNSEIQVNVSNVQISAEVSIGHGDLGGYELYDCVSLSENETAVVIHVGAEKLRVINHMNIVKDVFPQDVTSKRNAMSSKQSAFDVAQSTIVPGDIVKVINGNEYVGKTGTVKHVMRGNLWLHSDNHLKNSGVMVVRGRSCQLAGSNTTANSNNRAANVASLAGAVGGQGAAGANAPRFGRDPAIGKTVKIIRGGYKGHLAQVADATPTHYTLELLARVKKIMLEKAKTKEVGDKDGAFDKTAVGGVGSSNLGDVVGPLADVATPFLTAETPMHMVGSETPMHMAGNETPMVGGETPSGGRDADFWKPNEADRERQERKKTEAAAAMAAPTAFEITHNMWQPYFIVRILDGSAQHGSHGVLTTAMDTEGCFYYSLIAPTGEMMPDQLRAYASQLELADIKLGAHVKVLHGADHVVGEVGQCNYMASGHCMLQTATANINMLESSCAAVYHMAA